jgi:hypothetical protein
MASMMVSPALATQAGLLPIRNLPVRFAVGSPSGDTSNSWKVWATKSGVYLACRDSFKETKVSLHTSTNSDVPGRWRVGFSTEALPKVAHLLPMDMNRAWEVWDEPRPSLPGAVVAFRLFFPTSELAVKPMQRTSKMWKNVIHIESAPPGKLTALTVFVTSGEPALRHESEPSFRLALFDIGRGRCAQLVAHGEPENDFPNLVRRTVVQAIAQMDSASVKPPQQSYGYFFGRQPNGCRFIFGARIPSVQ